MFCFECTHTESQKKKNTFICPLFSSHSAEPARYMVGVSPTSLEAPGAAGVRIAQLGNLVVFQEQRY